MIVMQDRASSSIDSVNPDGASACWHRDSQDNSIVKLSSETLRWMRGMASHVI